MPSSPQSVPVVFVAWTERGGRAHEIAQSLGGRSLAVFPLAFRSRRAAPLRYVVSTVLTLGHLTLKRPRSVIVTNPPVFAGLTVAAYCYLARIPFLLDSHPTAFGAKNHGVARRLLPLSRWLTRQAAAVLVADVGLKSTVDSWGGSGLLVHEAPPAWTVEPAPAPSPDSTHRPRILYVGIFGGDEPVEAVIGAAALTPEFDVFVTGDVKRCPARILEQAPTNVTFTGYLAEGDYVDAIERADLMCALTTEPTSVMRSAYEAVYAGRPLVISDTEVLRTYFPHARFTPNRPEDLADAWRLAVRELALLQSRTQKARELQEARWEEQRMTLMSALSLVSSG